MEKQMIPEIEPIDIAAARARIGRLWGLERDLTYMELARALRLSPDHGGDYVSKMERGKTKCSGTVQALIEAFGDGYRPRYMDDIIKPGYPR